MNIFLYTNDFIHSLIILLVILYGTKLVNFYYNFYHIFSYLDYEQKLGYFKSNYLISLISKYTFVKKIIVHYILIPIIKLNYMFISIFITLLYSLCYVEFKKILRKQYLKRHKHKKNKKKTYDIIFTESSNDIINMSKEITSFGTDLNIYNNFDNYNISKDDTNLSNDDTNLSNDDTNLSKNDTNLSKDDIKMSKDEIILHDDIESGKYLIYKKNDFSNNVSHIDKISLDYDNGILNIIEFMSVEEQLQNSLDPNNIINQCDILTYSDNIKSKSIKNNRIENNKIEITSNSLNINKFNLLNEIDSLKTNNNIENENTSKNTYNGNINEDNINNYIFDVINDINNKINDNINDNINDDTKDDTNDNNINDYLFVDSKIENISKLIDINNLNVKNSNNSLLSINDEPNDMINLDDIDFGTNLENTINKKMCNNTNKSGTITVVEKKIIKIGKKKKN